jgi:HAMP domain-containing protein
MKALAGASLRQQLTLSHVLVALFLSATLGITVLFVVWAQNRSLQEKVLQKAATLSAERLLRELRRLEETRDGLARELAVRKPAGGVGDVLFLHRVLAYTDVERIEVFAGLALASQAYTLPDGGDPQLATRWYPEQPQLAALLLAGKPVTWLQVGERGVASLKTARRVPGSEGAGQLTVVVTAIVQRAWLAGALPQDVAGALYAGERALVVWPPGSKGDSSGLFSPLILRRALLRLDDDTRLELELRAAPQTLAQALAPALRAGVLVTFVAIALSMLLGDHLARRLLAPLADLLEGTAAMARGHLSVRLPVRRHDELGALTREFNRMADEIRTTYLGVIATLAEVVEAKSHYTREHIERVERLAMATAQVLEERGWAKWSSHQKFILSVAAILHDVGKIAIDNDILNKPGPLSGNERKEILSHPEVGATIVERMGKLDRAAEIIRACHEHYDGSGYPRGLKGEEIPLEARIILAVDAFDAMTQVRPYSKARPLEDAIAELRAEAGKQFDPVVVEALIEAVNRIERGEPVTPTSSSGFFRALADDSGETPAVRN